MNCQHQTAQDCEANDCELWSSSPWPCFARFHPDTYEFGGNLQTYLKTHFPETITIADCPTYKLQRNDPDYHNCAVHRLLFLDKETYVSPFTGKRV